MKVVVSAALLFALPSCGASGEKAGAPEPELRVEHPARGALADGLWVAVRGEASGMRRASVTVNGRAAELREDGSFELMVPLEPGVNLLETTLSGDSGSVSDVRAVLAGRLAPAAEAAPESLVLHFTAKSVELLAARAEELARAEIDALPAAEEPALTIGSDCFGADLYFERITMEDFEVKPRLVDEGLEFDISIRGLDAELSADYSLGCGEATTEVLLGAELIEATGRIEVGTDAGGDLFTEMTELESGVDEMTLDVGLLPEEFDAVLRSALEAYLTEIASVLVPSLANRVFDDVRTVGVVPLPGAELQIDVWPRVVEFSPEGGVIKADTVVEVIGREDVRYVSTRRLAPEAREARFALGLAVADDAFNQLLGAVWSAGLLSLDAGATGPLGLLQSLGVDHVKADFRLPPTLSAEDESERPVVTAGDIEVSLTRAGAKVARLAVSLRGALEVRASEGEILLSAGTPEIWIDVLESDGDFGDHELSILRELIASTVKRKLSAAIERSPGSSGLGALLASPGIEAAAGYVFVGEDL